MSGERITPYLVFSNTHDGSGAVKVAITPVRVVCNNTLNLALNTANRCFSMVHTGDIKGKIDEAKHTLFMADEYMEALGNDIFGAFRDQGQECPKDDTSKQSFGRDTINNIQLDTNLCVGKQLEIVLEDQGNKAVIPVTVRLAVNTVDTESMIHNLTLGGRQMTGKERAHRWQEKELALLGDILFVEDIIKQHRRALIKDKTGFFQDTLKRRRENRLSAIASGSASIADASSMVVLTSRTVKEIESRLGGKLSNMKVRQQLFNETAIMLMVVVNDDWGKVTVYHNSIDLPTTLSLTEVKNAAKGSGPDIGEILKAYQLGSAPSF